MKLNKRALCLVLILCSFIFSSITLGDTLQSLSSIKQTNVQSIDRNTVTREIKKLPNSRTGYSYYKLKDHSYIFYNIKDIYLTKINEPKGTHCGSIQNAGRLMWVTDLSMDRKGDSILKKLSKRMKIDILGNEKIICIIGFEGNSYFLLTSERAFFIEYSSASKYQIYAYEITRLY